MQDNKFDNSFISTVKDSHRDISNTRDYDVIPNSSNIQDSVIVVSEKRRRFSAQKKLEFVRLTYLPGNTISSIARAYGVAPSLLFKWRSLEKQGALEAIETGRNTIPAARYAEALEEIKQLQQLLGQVTADNAL